jgi:hypothetical protein
MQAIELYERHPQAGAVMKVLEGARALNVVLPEPASDEQTPSGAADQAEP